MSVDQQELITCLNRRIWGLEVEVRCLKTTLREIVSPPPGADQNFSKDLAKAILDVLERREKAEAEA